MANYKSKYSDMERHIEQAIKNRNNIVAYSKTIKNKANANEIYDNISDCIKKISDLTLTSTNRLITKYRNFLKVASQKTNLEEREYMNNKLEELITRRNQLIIEANEKANKRKWK